MKIHGIDKEQTTRNEMAMLRDGQQVEKKRRQANTRERPIYRNAKAPATV